MYVFVSLFRVLFCYWDHQIYPNIRESPNKSIDVLHVQRRGQFNNVAQDTADTSQQTDKEVIWRDSPWHRQKQKRMHLHWGSTWAHMAEGTIRYIAATISFLYKTSE